MDDKTLLEIWILDKASSLGRPYPNKTLAHDAGLSVGYISAVLNNRRGIGADAQRKLAAAFGVSVSEFLAGPARYPVAHDDAGGEMRAREAGSVISGAPSPGNGGGERMYGSEVSEDDLVRARIMSMVCRMSGSALHRAAGVLEGITAPAPREKKNINTAS